MKNTLLSHWNRLFIFFQKENCTLNLNRLAALTSFGLCVTLTYLNIHENPVIAKIILVLSLMSNFWLYHEMVKANEYKFPEAVTALLGLSLGLFPALLFDLDGQSGASVNWLLHMLFSGLFVVFFGCQSVMVAYKNTKKKMGDSFESYQEHMLLKQAISSTASKKLNRL